MPARRVRRDWKSFRRSLAGAGLLQEAWLWLGSHSRDDLLELADEAGLAVSQCRGRVRSRSAPPRGRPSRPGWWPSRGSLGGQAGSFRQRDVRAGIALGDVDSTKQSVDLALDERWLRSGVEEALEVAGTCRPPCLVEGRRDVVLNVRPEPILVPRHPPKQPGHGVGRPGGGCLPGGHPAGEQAAAEHAEIPARVIDLVGLLIAGGDERLVEPDGAFRVGLRDPRGDRFELVDKGEGRVFGDAAAKYKE